MAYFGLTGGIASGKSTVARMFEKLGAHVIDADRIGHEILRSDSPVFPDIIRHFGRDILDASGEIQRERLGAMVFTDRDRLAELNALVHPLIIKRVDEQAQAWAAREPDTVILVDAALIFEAGIGGRFQKVLVTWCRTEQQLERLMAKGLSREQAERRLAAQMSAEEKRRRADFVIDCSGSLDETLARVEALYPELQRLVRGAR